MAVVYSTANIVPSCALLSEGKQMRGPALVSIKQTLLD
jgi:hypothetical protein